MADRKKATGTGGYAVKITLSYETETRGGCSDAPGAAPTASRRLVRCQTAPCHPIGTRWTRLIDCADWAW